MARRLRSGRPGAAPLATPSEAHGRIPPLTREHHHRNIHGGAARAAVFGVSDGLVSNSALVLGVAGSHPAASVVTVAGLAGLIGGSFSMAAGEYVSMRAQRELFERELELERREIRLRPEGERRELAHIYESRGIDEPLAQELATRMMRDPEVALDTHAREELGIETRTLGSPLQAAAASFLTFGIGALVPLLAWFFVTGHAAVLATVACGVVASALVGAGLSIFTGRSWWWSAGRQLLITVCAAAVTYGIGSAVGASGIT